jgi:hypothetical protein
MSFFTDVFEKRKDVGSAQDGNGTISELVCTDGMLLDYLLDLRNPITNP